jgi:glycosyltransferase involved in cell wall biosynthesis
LVSEKDTGIYDAMNKGLRLATGDIIGILNADDIYANESVLSSVQSHFLSLNLDALYGDLEYFDSDQPLRAFRTYRSRGFSASKLSQGLMPAHPTLFLHRKVYQEYGLFNTTYKIVGDFEFIARIFGNQKLTTLYVPKIMVRMQSGGISTAGFKSTKLMLRENLRACKENGIYTNYLLLLSRYPRKLLEYFI